MNLLSPKLQNYALNLTKASYALAPIIMHQTSTESCLIYNLLSKMFQEIDKQSNFDLQSNKFFKNFGNYYGFGSQKIKPQITFEDFQSIFRQYVIEYDENDLQVLQKLYSNSPQYLPNQYFPDSLSKEEVKALDKMVNIQNVNTFITEGADQYIFNIPSVDQKQTECNFTFKNKKVMVKQGAYSQYLEAAVRHLKKAKLYAEDNQCQMLEELILHFQTGNLENHKNYSKLWVNDDCLVEQYFGFIETYRDPCGERAEMEGIVAIVNSDCSRMLKKLTQKDISANVLQLLPVSQFLQRETYIPPSYNAIETLSYVSSMVFNGINLPNYDDVRERYGFKNVSVQNVNNVGCYTIDNVKYVDIEKKIVIVKHQKQMQESILALHELFGHGSCKLLFENDFKKLSVNDQQELQYYYQKDETYNSKFGEIQSAFEECRAQITAHYLLSKTEVLKIFEIDEQSMNQFRYCTVWYMAYSGVQALCDWDNSWRESHAQADFMILMNVQAQTDCVKIGLESEKIRIYIDETKLEEVFEAHKKLVKQMNILRSAGRNNEAIQLITRLSSVSENYIQFKKHLEFRTGGQIIQPHRIVGEGQNERLIEIQGQSEYDAVMTTVLNMKRALE